jgi:hypothetical protein
MERRADTIQPAVQESTPFEPYPLYEKPLSSTEMAKLEEGFEPVLVEEIEAMPGWKVTEEDRLWALLGYIFCPLIGIIVLLIEDKKNRPFIKYNAWMSIVLGVLAITLSLVCIGILVWF